MNRRNFPSVLLTAVAAAMALCGGCSIKEDRGQCPCTLVLDFSNVDMTVAGEPEVFVSTSDGFLYHDPEAAARIGEGKYSGSYEYAASIPKDFVSIAVLSGADMLYSAVSGLLIPLGEECPPVYAHYSETDARAETCREVITMHKDFCRIEITMKKEDVGAEPYPFRLAVIGNVCGMNHDRSPLAGDFSCAFVPDGGGRGTVRVPRQTDNSLVLRVQDSDKVLREFALGEYIAESGYDWNAENLEDVAVEIDYANSYVSVKVADWSGSYEFEIVI